MVVTEHKRLRHPRRVVGRRSARPHRDRRLPRRTDGRGSQDSYDL